MLELFQHYSISEIFIFIVLLALATKGVVEFFSWGQEKLSKIFHFKYNKLTEKEKLQQQLAQQASAIQVLKEQQKSTDMYLKSMQSKIDLLIDSDKDDIKSFLTREHHYFCYTQGWIDDYSLECCERRYAHYRDEGGNSFIEGFMKELRALPKRPPNDSNNILRN